jgi:hypothetical protein
LFDELRYSAGQYSTADLNTMLKLYATSQEYKAAEKRTTIPTFFMSSLVITMRRSPSSTSSPLIQFSGLENPYVNIYVEEPREILGTISILHLIKFAKKWL